MCPRFQHTSAAPMPLTRVSETALQPPVSNTSGAAAATSSKSVQSSLKAATASASHVRLPSVLVGALSGSVGAGADDLQKGATRFSTQKASGFQMVGDMSERHALTAGASGAHTTGTYDFASNSKQPDATRAAHHRSSIDSGVEQTIRDALQTPLPECISYKQQRSGPGGERSGGGEERHRARRRAAASPRAVRRLAS